MFLKKNLLCASREDILRWIEKLKTEEYTNKSINRKIAVLKSFYSYHKRHNNISSKPTALIPKLKNTKIKILPIPEEVILKSLLEFNAGENRKKIRDLTILELLYYTGCRVDELINIKKRNVDFDKCRIQVMGKGGKERILTINPYIVNLIKLHSKLWRSKNKGRYLLNDNSGNILYPVLVSRLVKKELSDADNFAYPHRVRHSIASHLFNRGVSSKDIQIFLGHSSLQSSVRYIHIDSAIMKRIHNQCHPKNTIIQK